MSHPESDRLLPRPLGHLTFRPLPLGRVRPAGWLRNQLRIQAGGLSGYLDEFWPDVADSGWLGGVAEGWERGPYWLDGIVPLAFLLDDARLKQKVQRWVDTILARQHTDGWLGPIRDTARGDRYQAYDPWPVFVALKALTQYHDATGDPRILPALDRFLRRLERLLTQEKPLFDWGKFRWADLVLTLHWLYEKTHEAWLLALADTAHQQGYDWRGHFADFRYLQQVTREQCDLTTHVVNNAMAVKTAGVWFRQSQDAADRAAVYRALEMLDAYHGQATGVFAGDEHYAGKNPSQGTELCAVVEYLFSLETLVAILGDAALADRLERIAFNALPATFKPDMWAHQYDQQANQVVAKVAEQPVYTNNGPRANIFGLEPNYGCCTANMHQGWPKFAAHLWMEAAGGLVAVAYAPCGVDATANGAPVQVQVDTDYPFNETVTITVRMERPVRFPLQLRIPQWADGATVDGMAAQGPWHVIEREWRGGERLTLHLPMPVRIQRRYHQSVSIERGPLVYALRIGEVWQLIGGEPPHGDWEVHPTTPWNYALRIRDLDSDIRFHTQPVGDVPFSPDGAPVWAEVQGRRLPEWGLVRDAAGPLPESPVTSVEPLETLTLIPYGCTNLRVTEFPLLAE